MTTDTTKIRESAYRLLARREHSYKELQTKLKQREFDRDAIDAVLQDLIDEGLQSDARFAESYIRMRAMNGFGPERIPLELAERGVGQSLIDNAMANTEIDWQEYADTVYEKKYGVSRQDDNSDFPTKAKRLSFMRYRGFCT